MQNPTVDELFGNLNKPPETGVPKWLAEILELNAKIQGK